MLLPLVVLLAPAALASGYTCDSLLPALCPLQERHGTVEVRGATLHYWTYAPEGWSQVPDSLLPVVTIHGGPGFPHNYLLPLKLLACQGRQVVFYDQVGTGESSICPPVEEGENPNGCPVDEAHSHLLTLWYYPEEVATLVEELGLAATGYHLLGHSWGTVVAALHAATSPYGLRSVVLAGGVANMTTYINAQWDPVEGNLGTLPPAMQDRLRQLEAAGDYADQEYLRMVAVLTTQFTVRTFPEPDCVAYCSSVLNADIYVKMQGPSEFSVTDDTVMAGMDLSPELRRISVPVLLTNGAYDTMRGPNIRAMAAELQDVTMAIFPRSGHMTMVDEPEEMSRQLTDWWAGVEARDSCREL